LTSTTDAVTLHPPESRPAMVAPATTTPLVELFSPGVVAYRIAESEFALADDLARFDHVRAVGAIEAAILYCTRIVEAMARAALGPTNPDANAELGGLLRELFETRQIPSSLNRLLAQLRTLGNDARHANRSMSSVDADAAFIILVRWLHWSFCEAVYGPRLASIMVPNQPADALLPRELARLVDDSAATGEAVLASLTGPDPGASPALLTPVIPAAAAEALLARDRWEAAHTILDLALRRFPRDLRLRQLIGLYWSRRGQSEESVEHLHRARKELEPLRLRGRASAADEETFGILAGVYKRLAELDPTNAADWLRQCQFTYREGWEQSRRTNGYLGINAATMAVLLGQPMEVAEEIAGLIRDRLSNLQDRLRASSGVERPLTYWDQVTWAEAELLLSNWGHAGELYRDAFARFATRTRDIAETVRQARRVLDRLSRRELAAGVLGRWADAAG